MSVLLKKPLFKDISNRELAQQLEARKKCRIKLPTWFDTPKIYYPKKLNIEQTSSEITAKYKSKITAGKSILDATGGFGVDSYFFSQKFEEVLHCEIDENLSRIAAYNFKTLGAENIKTFPKDGMDFLQNSKRVFDWIYVDPSRRNDSKARVFGLSDSLPNILEHLALLFEKSGNILLKTSPLLDFSAGINQLHFVKEINVVAIENEVKELLWVLKKDFEKEIVIKTINFTKLGTETFDFVLSEEKNVHPLYANPRTYLYEPNAAILKAGAFKIIANRLKINKLHEHTHLYTSDQLIDFPGRTFKIENIFPYNRKTIQKMGIRHANITTRNFPETVAEIRKRYLIRDGGKNYLFFTRGIDDEKMVVSCSKVMNV